MDSDRATTPANGQEALVAQARRLFEASIATKRAVLEGDQLAALAAMATRTADALAKGGTLLLCGNGGSAADAQHLAAELLVRLRSSVNRQGLPAIALAMDSSTLTACGNDYGYEVLFERMVGTLGRPGDVLLGITTSGRSPNVIRALKAARRRGLVSLGFLGGDGGPALEDCDMAFVAPSTDTARVQETHITAGHALMEMIEDRLLATGYLTRSDPA
ncbi:SIS domain-containing protein [Azospirillum agricola]|uniref:SIS domain-containing protein n=1 Tax=Azospirillum agricola TaxID=1720247 RepID=UPI000A0F35D4|nr:SIS domain-containing protein [Azospirillum agricola]SMH41114.1 D-sedoheptulose 7-phosphate isomerase [Azospirillum lipoferum]